MSKDSSVDSELAALLDEELFQEEDAVTNADTGDRPRDTEEDEEQQQQPKRARREPLVAEDTGSDFSGVDEDDDDDDEEEEEQQQQVTGYICPPHPGWWMGLCIRCGAARRTDDAAQQGNNANNAAAPVTKIKHLHHKQALEVSADEAARIAQGSSQRLNAQKRLMLVLDLDHTLLNTVRDIDLVGPEREAAIKQLEQQHRALQQQQQQMLQATANQQQHPAADGPEDTHQDHHQQQQQQQEGDGQQGAQEATDPAAGHGRQPAPGAAATATAANANTLQDSSELRKGQHRQQQQQQQEDNEQEEQEDEVSKSAAAAAAAAGAGQQGRPHSGSSGGSSNGNGQSCGPRAQLYYFRDKGLWTKLRPGVAAFLSAVSQLYELHIYTMGDKGYAGLMADTLDPEHRLFVGRVISSADSTRASVKDLDVLLADESLVLILDDTEHVWEKHKANLIQVERYHYFGASAKLFHPGAVSPLGQGTDEPEQGGMLDNAAQLLTRIHARVYGADAQQQQQQVDVQQEQQQQEQEQEQGDNALLEQQGSVPGVRRVKRPIKRLQQQAAAAAAGAGGAGGSGGAGGVRGHNDVRECLEAERHSVLQGCCIVFSRCWPQQQEPSAHPLWQLAVQLGASCSLTLHPGTTTHLIVAPDLEQPPGNVPFTDKVQAAQKAGIPVVHPDWLLACKFAWKQLPASAFSLKSYVSVAGSGCCSRRLLGPARNGPGGPGASAAERAAVLKSAGRTGA